MRKIKYIDFQHLHIIVDDLEAASAFYRNVMDMVEMQTHERIVNQGLAAYYGVSNPEDFVVSLRFMAIPGVLTLKLIKIESPFYGSVVPEKVSGTYNKSGLSHISIAVEDLNSTYDHFLAYARNYNSKHKIKLVSHPVFLSPLSPHEISASENSVLRGQDEILQDILETFQDRAKFQMEDPYGVKWEFNNNLI